jgi:S1-C subfamily serine protease
VVVAGILGAAAVGAGIGAGTYALLSNDGTTVARGLPIGSIYDLAHRGVVEITASMRTRPPLAQEVDTAQGSGWIYDSAGHIVTNQHVVGGADKLSVHFWNGARYPATLVGGDSSKDLAVIKAVAPSSLLHPLKVGNSDALHVGDGVVAIGSPFGLEETVTSGIVSALHREITALTGSKVADSIQTDTVINGGSSGSPLLNAKGEVAGVAAVGDAVGVAFAISSHTVASVVPRLISNRR